MANLNSGGQPHPNGLSKDELQLWEGVLSGGKNWYTLDGVAIASGVDPSKISSIYDTRPEIFIRTESKDGYLFNTVQNYRARTNPIERFLDFSTTSFNMSSSSSD